MARAVFEADVAVFGTVQAVGQGLQFGGECVVSARVMRGAVLRRGGEDNQAVAVAIEADAVVGGAQDGCCLVDVSGDAVDVVKPPACAHGIIQRTRVAEVVSGVVVCIERQFFRINGDMFALRDV